MEAVLVIKLDLRNPERCAQLTAILSEAGHLVFCQGQLDLSCDLCISDSAPPAAPSSPWLVLLPPDADAAPWVQAGAWDVLREPLQPEDLLTRVRLVQKLKGVHLESLNPLKSLSSIIYRLLFKPHWDLELPAALAELGQSMHARRLYLYEHRLDEAGQHELHKWGEWIAPQAVPVRPLPGRVPLTTVGLERWVQVLSAGQPLIGPLATFPEYEQRLMRRYALHSLAVIPIHTGETWWGLLGVDLEPEKGYAFSIALHLLYSSANILGTAIHFQQIQADLQRKTQSIDFLQAFIPLIQNWSTARNLSELGVLALQEVCGFLDASRGVIWIRPEDGRPVLQLLSAYGYRPEQEVVPGAITLKADEGLAGWVAQQRQSAYVPDVSRDPRWVDKGRIDENVRSALSVPLIYQDTVIGVMTLANLHTEPLLAQHQVLAETLATLVAGVIVNAQLYQQLQRRAQELELIQRITIQLTQDLDTQHVLDTILSALQDLVPYDEAVVQSYDAQQQTISLLGARGKWIGQGNMPMGVPFPLTLQSPHAWVLDRETPIVIADLQQEFPSGQHRFLQNVPGRSLLGTALRTRSGLQGLLLLTKEEPNFYTSDHVRLVTAFAAAAALALENSRLFAQEQDQRRLAEALMTAMTLVNEPLEVHEVIRRILEQVEKVVPGDTFNVMLLEGEHVRMFQRYQAHAVSPESPEKIYFLDELPLLQKLLRTREPVIVSDTHTEPLWVPIEGTEAIRAYLAMPIHRQEQIVGFLNINSLIPYRFTPVMAQQLQAFADQVAIALEHAHLYTQLRAYATTLEERVAARTQDLQAQTARLQAILHSIHEGLVVIRSDGTLVEANPQAQAWLEGNLPAAARTQLRQALIELARKQDQASTVILELPGLDLQLQAAPVSASNLIVVTLTDITPLKSLERMKSRLITTISHELRTPVTTIQLYARLLEKAQPERKAEYLLTLRNETNRLAKILEDVIQLSRLDAGQLDLRFQAFDLSEALEQTLAVELERFEKHGLTLTSAIMVKPLWIYADRNQIIQLLQQLLSNARFYTPPGGSARVTLDLDTEQTPPRACISVEDTGVGIGADELPHIFERFFRGSQTKNQQIPGTGLGLSMVKEIVTLHHGEITVQSTPGKGSHFTVYLPLTTPEAERRDLAKPQK